MRPAGILARNYRRTDTTVGTGRRVEMVLLGLITTCFNCQGSRKTEVSSYVPYMDYWNDNAG